jgi:hypothetical protein
LLSQPGGRKSRVSSMVLAGGCFLLRSRGVNLLARGIVLSFGRIEIRLREALAFQECFRSRKIRIGPAAGDLSMAELRPRSSLVLTSSIELALCLFELNVVVFLPQTS